RTRLFLELLQSGLTARWHETRLFEVSIQTGDLLEGPRRQTRFKHLDCEARRLGRIGGAEPSELALRRRAGNDAERHQCCDHAARALTPVGQGVHGVNVPRAPPEG